MVSQSILAILFMICCILLQALLGYSISEALRRSSNRFFKTSFNEISTSDLPMAFIVGLLTHLYAIWFLKCLDPSWILAVALPLMAGIPGIRGFSSLLRKLQFRLTLSFTVWTITVIVIGLSIFTPGSSIQTPWVNNYGDITLHMGMIASFVSGANFPVEYHLLAGEALSYPFLVNLWTASIWWISPSYESLAHIFQLQWLLAWSLVYYFLRGDKFNLLPWALLLGGGSFDLLLRSFLAEPSSPYFQTQPHHFLDSGFPWTQFLPSLWVTQRTLLLGLPCILASLALFHRWYEHARLSIKVLATPPLAALAIAALSVMAHTHLCVVILAYELLAWVWLWKVEFWQKDRPASQALGLAHFNRSLGAIGCALIPLLLALPLLSAKTQLIAFMPGWYAGSFKALMCEQWGIPSSIALWLSGAWPWFLLLAVMFLSGFHRRLLVLIALIFVVANFVKLAIWEWDQIKVFLALYVISLQLISNKVALGRATSYLILPLLIIPGVVELGRTYVDYNEYTVYTARDLELAELIRKHTPTNAIILAAPDHNSPATIAGRRLFYGYEGTLHSHGLPYETRQVCMNSLSAAVRCNSCLETTSRRCMNGPDYLLWSDREQKFWSTAEPDASPGLVDIADGKLYRIHRAQLNHEG